ncbi:hypothetical protein [Pseudomonas syringae]|uniref:hypothetical protein n=1 Tax=Pseudomonas syringae TaxID=317 RepID=UPI002459AE59|nr:hypothetical protein [Pseudomonas syringae]MDH4602413.1 hypothetical protein [Pseudomonas syringae pv. papulans]
MAHPTDNKPFHEIIQRALAGRRAAIGECNRHPIHNAPRYVVHMCEALTELIHDMGNQDVTLADVLRTEGTCTGTDYQQKLALRCHRLAQSATA